MARKSRERSTGEKLALPPEVGSGSPTVAAQPYRRWAAIGAVLLMVAIAIVWAAHYRGTDNPATESASTPSHAEYVGGEACVGCHATQAKAWTGSDHDLAMQVADAKTVLGNFDDARFTYAGTTSRFFRRDGRFFVSTDGVGGKVADHEIKYTFGVRPLQQYLIEMPGGRLQAFGIAWDARSREQGGQHWFHLYPKDALKAGDALHWTGVNQNWNFMCSECHSTALKKNYNADTATFDTKWKALNVSCEACHGPASKHLEWAKTATSAPHGSSDKDLVNPLNARRDVIWHISQGETPPQRRGPHAMSGQETTELDTCARCHTRASRISDDYIHGQPPLNTHVPSLISRGLYWNDGQQRDEVFTSGSFAQSKMHAKGVVCSNCHEPHSLKLRAEGNAVCTQCHAAEKFDAAAHTHHSTGTVGAKCVACHMPATTYMQVDPRHDHSMRIPRPDLSAKFGLANQPNACNGCHAKQTAAWAAAKLGEWNTSPKLGFQTFAASFHQADAGETSAVPSLQALVADAEQPAIVRASALERLAPMMNAAVFETMVRGLNDADAQVRLASVDAMSSLAPAQRRRYLAHMTGDSVRAVRTGAARALAGAAEAGLTATERVAFDTALAEYIATLDYNADRPESQLSLGNLWSARGDLPRAEQHLRQALKLDVGFVEAYVNLADLQRSQATGGEAAAERLLRDGLRNVSPTAAPESAAPLHHALGLSLIRQKRHVEALSALADAVKRDPNHARYAYVLGVALHSKGDHAQGIRVLQRALDRRQNDPEILAALAQFSAQAGRRETALRYLERLQALDPQNQQYRQLAMQIIGAKR